MVLLNLNVKRTGERRLFYKKTTCSCFYFYCLFIIGCSNKTNKEGGEAHDFGNLIRKRNVM
ncbi:hypothetical protein J8TS2_11330 [Lederbergia ruris]|uniref:Lipoprotein n=1 Tax=Lederbergia ruris TaxID=217495 RepID=A0ABQ4KI56_9BACI|nr:hypothetical protein J8TS2_11330 [Lederbergia ruris]